MTKKNIRELKVCVQSVCTIYILISYSKILPFVTVHGSSNSHTAILARMMNIPALIGMPLKALSVWVLTNCQYLRL